MTSPAEAPGPPGADARVARARIDLAIRRAAAVLAFSVAMALALPAAAVERKDGEPAEPGALTQATPPRVNVQPRVQDAQIRDRLLGVLEATEWFERVAVRVEQGVVFLDGSTSRAELKSWAGELATNTEDVVAVVNRIRVADTLDWNFRPAREGLQQLWHDAVRSIPFLSFGLVILLLATLVGHWTTRIASRLLASRVRALLLRAVLARAAGALVLLAGVYIVLRVAGLTQLALTVVGGTGLLGLAVGIAFRDITENFLASIFLSVQRPFQTGDLVEVDGVTGYVRQLNVRTTVLVNLDGNLVQIPNATVYKSTLRNFTANPKRRETFTVGIGYDDRIDKAQEVAREVLAHHPAVLDDPEPWVLADSLGTSTVQLRVYFWLNGCEHSWLKVRSSVIRLVKRAFQDSGISMPDEAREVIFPRGVPVVMGEAAEGNEPRSALPPAETPSGDRERRVVSTQAEGGLDSEAAVLARQVCEVDAPGGPENLLPEAPAGPFSEQDRRRASAA